MAQIMQIDIEFEPTLVSWTMKMNEQNYSFFSVLFNLLRMNLLSFNILLFSIHSIQSHECNQIIKWNAKEPCYFIFKFYSIINGHSPANDWTFGECHNRIGWIVLIWVVFFKTVYCEPLGPRPIDFNLYMWLNYFIFFTYFYSNTNTYIIIIIFAFNSSNSWNNNYSNFGAFWNANVNVHLSAILRIAIPKKSYTTLCSSTSGTNRIDQMELDLCWIMLAVEPK